MCLYSTCTDACYEAILAIILTLGLRRIPARFYVQVWDLRRRLNLNISSSLLGEQSSCPQLEKDQDVGGTLSDIPQVTITSMHYVFLFDMY